MGRYVRCTIWDQVVATVPQYHLYCMASVYCYCIFKTNTVHATAEDGKWTPQFREFLQAPEGPKSEVHRTYLSYMRWQVELDYVQYSDIDRWTFVMS